MDREAFKARLAAKSFGHDTDGVSRYRKKWEDLQRFASPEHTPKYAGVDICDALACACGWVSKSYYDGVEFAYADWAQHVLEASKPENWIRGVVLAVCPALKPAMDNGLHLPEACKSAAVYAFTHRLDNEDCNRLRRILLHLEENGSLPEEE